MGLSQTKGRGQSAPAQTKSGEAQASQKAKQKSAILLLYGTGESGKTTILRQMMLIHGNVLLADRRQYKGIIASNVLEGAALTIRAGQRRFGFNFDDKHSQRVLAASARLVPSAAVNFNLDDADLRNALIQLYVDNDDFKDTLKRSNEYQIHDGWEFLMNALLEGPPDWGTSTSNWVPSAEELLHARIRTTGRQHQMFEYEGHSYKLVDVGGQRHERRKFLHLFARSRCVLYVVSLSEYDERLFEDDEGSRFVESINEWTKSVNSEAFEDLYVLLIFNKFDLFKKKYFDEQRPIETFFADVPTPPVVEDESGTRCELALNWFEAIYRDRVEDTRRLDRIQTFVITALEREKVNEAMQFGLSLLRHKKYL